MHFRLKTKTKTKSKIAAKINTGYTELAADATQRGWNAKVWPVEVGCRGFVGSSTIRLLKELGIHGQALRQTVRAVSQAAERGSQWIWIKRKDPCWAITS